MILTGMRIKQRTQLRVNPNACRNQKIKLYQNKVTHRHKSQPLKRITGFLKDRIQTGEDFSFMTLVN